MTVFVRRAGSLDAAGLASLINEIIRVGGTTALTRSVSKPEMLERLQMAPDRSAWHVAESEAGRILGVQSVEPHTDLPPDACDIATFVQVGQTGLGVGSLLFPETARAARDLGYRWINATIRADNAGGLAYYQSRGFERYASVLKPTLVNGDGVDRISLRYTLD